MGTTRRCRRALCKQLPALSQSRTTCMTHEFCIRPGTARSTACERRYNGAGILSSSPSRRFTALVLRPMSVRSLDRVTRRVRLVINMVGSICTRPGSFPRTDCAAAGLPAMGANIDRECQVCELKNQRGCHGFFPNTHDEAFRTPSTGI